MEVKSSLPVVTPIWVEWWAEAPRRRVTVPRKSVWRTVRVLPGNPSLPLRVFLGELTQGVNGGVGGTALGIDLRVRGNEVRKLFYAGGFTGTLLREGIDPDEFLQEVYRGILARNKGTCPWDAKKSSFGHYVHIIIRCVLSNYLRRERLHGSRECVTDDGELPGGDLGSVGGGTVELDNLLASLYGDGAEQDRVRGFLSALYAGQTRKSALSMVGMADEWGARVLSEVRQALISE